MPLAACWQPARRAPWQWSRPALRDWNWSRFLSSCLPVHRALSFTVHTRMKNYPQRTFTAPSTVDNAQGEQRNTASGGNKKRLGHTSKKRDHALTASRTALSPETAMASLKAAPAHQLPAQPRNVHKLIEGSLVGATLHSVDGTGHLVRAIVPQPARVTQAHRRVARLLGRETDLIVGGGVPQLPTSSTRKRQVAMQRHAHSQPSSSPGEPKSTAAVCDIHVTLSLFQTAGTHAMPCKDPRAIRPGWFHKPVGGVPSPSPVARIWCAGPGPAMRGLGGCLTNPPPFPFPVLNPWPASAGPRRRGVRVATAGNEAATTKQQAYLRPSRQQSCAQ